MTDTPDDLPSPDEFRKKVAYVDQEFADARRYLSALCADDNQGLVSLMAEIHGTGRAMKVWRRWRYRPSTSPSCPWTVSAAMSRSGSTRR
jgi:hypothetical protein